MRRFASVFLFITVGLSITAWGQPIRTHTITGRIVFEDGRQTCDYVEVELELVQMQTIDSTFLDPSCNFRFHQVAAGNYYIHIKADGYEETRQPIEVMSVEGATPIQIELHPVKRNLVKVPDGGPYIVDIQELARHYPKKAAELYRKSFDNRKKGKNKDATRQLEQAVKIAPDFYAAHNELGLLYIQAGRLAEAESQFFKAHELSRHATAPLVNLSHLYLEENQPDKALEYSEEAVGTNSRSAPALYNMGIALFRISRLDKAEDAFKKALALAPSMAQIHLALANIYLKLQRYDHSVEQLNAYLEESPKAPDRQKVEQIRDEILKSIGDER